MWNLLNENPSSSSWVNATPKHLVWLCLLSFSLWDFRLVAERSKISLRSTKVLLMMMMIGWLCYLDCRTVFYGLSCKNKWSAVSVFGWNDDKLLRLEINTIIIKLTLGFGATLVLFLLLYLFMLRVYIWNAFICHSQRLNLNTELFKRLEMNRSKCRCFHRAHKFLEGCVLLIQPLYTIHICMSFLKI